MNKENNQKNEEQKNNSEIETLIEEVRILKEREDLWKEKCADLINQVELHKKRKEETLKFGQKKILTKLLFFLDDFEKALESSIKGKKNEEKEVIQSFLKGFLLNVEEFKKILGDEGVEKISVIPFKDKFDPEKHEIIKVGKNENYPDETILEEIRVGYLLNKKILRYTWIEINKLEKK